MMTALLHRIREQLWEREWVTVSQRRLMWAGRYLFALAHDLWEGQITMRAMSLVYTTLLSIVPMLALGFSVLKALGVHNSLEPVLRKFLEPLGSQADNVTLSIIGFVEKMQVGVLGFVGIVLLFYTAVSMIQKVESSFNFIWRIETGRPLSQRLGEYTMILVFGPVLVFSALGLTATMMSSTLMARIAEVNALGFAIDTLARLIPYALIVCAFTFLYSFVPNTPVKLKAAASGGLLAGVLWQSGSVLFASFVASATNYNAIYSGFAIIIFLLIWLYVGWLILLIGCGLAFYVQNPQHLRAQRVPPMLSGRGSEYLALMIMAEAGKRLMQGEPAPTRDELMRNIDAPPEHLLRMTENLIYHGLLTEAGPRSQQLLPAIDLDSLPLARLWRLARAGNTPMPRSKLPASQKITQLLDTVESSFETSLGSISLRQWLAQQQEKP